MSSAAEVRAGYGTDKRRATTTSVTASLGPGSDGATPEAFLLRVFALGNPYDIPVTTHTRVSSVLREVAELAISYEQSLALGELHAALCLDDVVLPVEGPVGVLPPNAVLRMTTNHDVGFDAIDESFTATLISYHAAQAPPLRRQPSLRTGGGSWYGVRRSGSRSALLTVPETSLVLSPHDPNLAATAVVYPHPVLLAPAAQPLQPTSIMQPYLVHPPTHYTSNHSFNQYPVRGAVRRSSPGTQLVYGPVVNVPAGAEYVPSYRVPLERGSASSTGHLDRLTPRSGAQRTPFVPLNPNDLKPRNKAFAASFRSVVSLVSRPFSLRRRSSTPHRVPDAVTPTRSDPDTTAPQTDTTAVQRQDDNNNETEVEVMEAGSEDSAEREPRSFTRPPADHRGSAEAAVSVPRRVSRSTPKLSPDSTLPTDHVISFNTVTLPSLPRSATETAAVTQLATAMAAVEEQPRRSARPRRAASSESDPKRIPPALHSVEVQPRTTPPARRESVEGPMTTRTTPSGSGDKVNGTSQSTQTTELESGTESEGEARARSPKPAHRRNSAAGRLRASKDVSPNRERVSQQPSTPSPRGSHNASLPHSLPPLSPTSLTEMHSGTTPRSIPDGVHRTTTQPARTPSPTTNASSKVAAARGNPTRRARPSRQSPQPATAAVVGTDAVANYTGTPPSTGQDYILPFTPTPRTTPRTTTPSAVVGNGHRTDPAADAAVPQPCSILMVSTLPRYTHQRTFAHRNGHRKSSLAAGTTRVSPLSSDHTTSSQNSQPLARTQSGRKSPNYIVESLDEEGEDFIRITLRDPVETSIFHFSVPVYRQCPVGALRSWLTEEIAERAKSDGRPVPAFMDVKAYALYCGETRLMDDARLTFDDATRGKHDCIFSIRPLE